MSAGLFGIHAAALKAKTPGMDTDQAAAAATLYRVPVMPSLDGNTVELPTEQVAFAANAVGYASTLSFISDSVGEITRALKGD
ncbi:flagellar basal body rod protein FlgB [Sphingopyxis chilensis]